MKMKMEMFGIHRTIKMKKLENKFFRGIGKGIATASLTGLTALLLSTEACTPAQQKVVVADVIIEEAKTKEQLMAGYLLKTLGEMEHDIEVAKAGKTEVNVNVGEERNTAGDYRVVKIEERNKSTGGGLLYITDAEEKILLKKSGEKIIGVPYHVERNKGENVYEPVGIFFKNPEKAIPLFFTYNKWVDLNNNKSAEREELFGLGKEVFDLDKEYLTITWKNYFSTDDDGVFRSWTETGTLLGETPVIVRGGGYSKSFITGLNSKYNDSPNFLDKLRINGPGKYMVTLNVPGIEQTFRLDLNIIN